MPVSGQDSLEAISDLSAIDVSSHSLTLTWTAPGNANEKNRAAHYDIRLSQVTNESAVWWDSLTTAVANDIAPKAEGERESLYVESLVPNSDYCFGIVSLDAANRRSDLSNVVSAHTAGVEDTIPPARISDLFVSSRDSISATLAWTAPGDDSLSGRANRYEVLYAISPQGIDQAQTLDESPEPGEPGTRDYVRIDKLTPGSTHDAWVRTGDKSGNWSSSSNRASFTTSDTQDTTTTDLDTIPPARVLTLEVYRVRPHDVILRWRAPGDDGVEGRAAFYEIRHASFSFQSDWDAAIVSHFVSASGEAWEYEYYEVSALEEGEHYYFALRARDESYNWSETSKEVHVQALQAVVVRPDTLDFMLGETNTIALDATHVNRPENSVFRIESDVDWITAVPDRGNVSVGTRTIEIEVDHSRLEPGLYEVDLHVATCCDTSTVVVSIEVPDRNVYGYVVEIIDAYDANAGDFGKSTAPIQGASVLVGEHNVFTDDNGFFHFEVPEGEYRFFIARDGYSSFDSTVQVGPPVEIIKPLEPELVDYFPLAVGNWYHYKYREFWTGTAHNPQGGENIWQFEYEIMARHVEEGDTVFSIRKSEIVADTVSSVMTSTIRYRDNEITGNFLPFASNSVLTRRYYPGVRQPRIEAVRRPQPYGQWLNRGEGVTLFGGRQGSFPSTGYEYILLDHRLAE